MNIVGHNPDGKLRRFLDQHRNFKVPVKEYGKKGHNDRGEVIPGSYFQV